MEKFALDKIRVLTPDLIKLIDCNVILISHLRAAETIADVDEYHLVSKYLH